MLEISLTYSTVDGSKEVPIERERTSFGRGDADYRLDDDGLSRVHATVYRDGDNVWIVDENSTNGSFVNGEKVGGSGTILKNGDTIKIGNHTKMTVRIGGGKAAQTMAVQAPAAQTKTVSSSAKAATSSMLIPALITMFALFVIGIAAVFIGVKVIGGSKSDIVYKSNESDESAAPDYSKDEEETKKTPEKTPKPEKTTAVNSSAGNTSLTNTPESLNSGTTVALPTGKKYQAMTDDEKNRYIALKSEKIARIIGNQKS